MNSCHNIFFYLIEISSNDMNLSKNMIDAGEKIIVFFIIHGSKIFIDDDCGDK